MSIVCESPAFGFIGKSSHLFKTFGVVNKTLPSLISDLVNKIVDLRAGLVFDESPIPDQTLDVLVPSGDRWLFTAGLGVHCNKWTCDFAYNFLFDEDRTFNNDAGVSPAGALTGEFKDIYAHIFGINVSYKF